MRKFALIAAVSAAALTAAAAGAAERITDVEYLQAARCAGLAQAAGGDASFFETKMRQNRQGRSDYVRAQARTGRDQARSDFRAASGEARAQLEAEIRACEQMRNA
ncbi:hypothetical protein Q0812_01750 [Brevundimonas sp. 2R-24]|uniref:DUF4398 domain-containing protein n=1 Tax=Peiella sedimenti TaxID=3061083 RepID=A0ABT8SK03_9CAUL|nr:hypothetical protein [Caulobacteraceae bacterium XZ-24]